MMEFTSRDSLAIMAWPHKGNLSIVTLISDLLGMMELGEFASRCFRSGVIPGRRPRNFLGET